MMWSWKESLEDAHKVLNEFREDSDALKKCETFGNALVQCFKSGNKVLICGNGGSHCDAMHFAEEWTGRYRKNRRALPVLALGEASHMSCVSNDFGFEHVFSRQIEAFAKKDDLLIALSTSGNSPNILRALRAAHEANTKTWALLGREGGEAAKLAQNSIICPGMTADRIQELHMLLLHIAIEHVERRLFPENY